MFARFKSTLMPSRGLLVAVLCVGVTLLSADSSHAGNSPAIPSKSLIQVCLDFLMGEAPVQSATEALEDYHRLVEDLERNASAGNVEHLADRAFKAVRQFVLLYDSGLPDDSKLLALPMRPAYIGESKRKSAEYLWGDKDLVKLEPTIRYFGEEERAQHRVTIRDGRAYWANGKRVRGIQGREFVIGLDGELYLLFDSEDSRAFRHSSFFAGDPVAGAGKISFGADGQITHLTRMSGHYHPTRNDLARMISWFYKMGMDIDPNDVDWESEFG